MIKIISRYKAIKEEDKTIAVHKIVSQATPDFDFFFMMVVSVLMATFGLLANNETVVIGSMLLAPLMDSILSLGLGLSMSSNSVISSALNTIIKAIVVALISAGLVTIFVALGLKGSDVANEVIMSRTAPTLLYFVVAFLSGIAVTYTAVKPHLSSALTGVAVSVALIPPLAVVGIGLASFHFSIAIGAFLMVLVNIAGILFASMISFSLMDVHHKKYLANKVLDNELKRLEKEEKRVEKISSEMKKEPQK